MLPSEKTLTPGDGTLKTTTDIITAHTASAAHGIGAGIIALIGAHITIRTGVHGVIVHGDITDTTTHGTMVVITIHGITVDTGEVTMTRGITEDTMEACTPDTGVGMIHGTITITTADGMIRTIITITQGLHTSEQAEQATGIHTMVFVYAPNPTEHSARAIALRANRQVQSEQPAALSEAA